MRFRWDKVVEAVIAAGSVVVIAASPLMSDGITRNEWGTLVLTFLGTFFTYLKDHAPVEGPPNV